MNRRRLPLFYHRERSAAIGIGATVTFAPIASSLSLLAMTGKSKTRCGARGALEYRDGCLDFARNSKEAFGGIATTKTDATVKWRRQQVVCLHLILQILNVEL